jgi:hypothetical protein
VSRLKHLRNVFHHDEIRRKRSRYLSKSAQKLVSAIVTLILFSMTAETLARGTSDQQQRKIGIVLPLSKRAPEPPWPNEIAHIFG